MCLSFERPAKIVFKDGRPAIDGLVSLLEVQIISRPKTKRFVAAYDSKFRIPSLIDTFLAVTDIKIVC